MGYICHHAILVTSWSLEKIQPAIDEAVRVFGPERVSHLLHAQTNGFETFVIGPDGSKEGWDTSDEGDGDRDVYVAWLDAQRHEDGSSWLSWAEVQYGDEDGHDCVLRWTRQGASGAPGAASQEPKK